MIHKCAEFLFYRLSIRYMLFNICAEFYELDVQVLCHVVPSLVKLRKEGLDGHEKIKSYMCV